MTESLLQFLWLHQYFNRSELCTEQGDALEIVSPGIFNTNQGPDFSDARVRIGGTVWAGNIELHVQAADWYRHGHQHDPNYQNIVLHVVWKNDEASQVPQLPTLALEPRVSTLLLDRYASLMKRARFVACENDFDVDRVPDWPAFLATLLEERLTRKAAYIVELLVQSNYHWEETLWWMLARYFGGPLNADAFEQVARSIPLQLLAKHKSQHLHLEALLLGQAGLLNKRHVEQYPVLLTREYRFLARKYGLRQPAITLKFLRMRPSGFPTVRLAQLASLIGHSTQFFATIRDARELSEVRAKLDVTANDYWHYHYRFDELSAFQPKKLGNDMVNNLLMNAVIPVLYAFGHHYDLDVYKAKASTWMKALPAESNAIVRGWKKRIPDVPDAFDSQALLELKTNYCDKRRCLYCAMGKALLRSEK